MVKKLIKNVTVITMNENNDILKNHNIIISGDTIEKIAYEKAGIIKENTPVLWCGESKEAGAVIEQAAKEKAAAAAAKTQAEERRKAQEAIEKAKRERREAAARKKALAEEMEKRQLTFF